MLSMFVLLVLVGKVSFGQRYDLNLDLNYDHHHREQLEMTPVLHLDSGSVRGYVHFVDQNVKVHSYTGIRYGEVKRRFEKAKPYVWNGVYDATKPKYACPQPGKKLKPATEYFGYQTDSMSEDCLFLNVFTPITMPHNRSVMVWIHGGTFTNGSIFSQVFDGSFLVNLGDVVVVTINYRLGPFGFLYSGDGANDVPGNLAIHDQILALNWIQENIQHFGGDPSKVTLFGESAGSMCVGLLVLSPLAKGLFHRAIMQSGGPNSFIGAISKKESLRRTESLLARLDCSHLNMADSIECLRDTNVMRILEATRGVLFRNEIMVPVYGDSVMPEAPIKALEAGHFNKVDLLFGVTRNEGSSYVALLPGLGPNVHKPNITLEQTSKLIQLMMGFFQVDNPKEVADYYTANLDPSDTNAMRMTIANAFADFNIVCPTILMGETLAKHFPDRHFYTYRLTRPLTSLVHCTDWMGVCHGEDVHYVFGIPIRLHSSAFTPQESILSYDMIQSWTRFAKTGLIETIGKQRRPWVESLDRKESKPSARYMNLNPTNYTMVANFFKQTCDDFWTLSERMLDGDRDLNDLIDSLIKAYDN